jgi:hypothetical protein
LCSREVAKSQECRRGTRTEFRALDWVKWWWPFGALHAVPTSFAEICLYFLEEGHLEPLFCRAESPPRRGKKNLNAMSQGFPTASSETTFSCGVVRLQRMMFHR